MTMQSHNDWNAILTKPLLRRISQTKRNWFCVNHNVGGLDIESVEPFLIGWIALEELEIDVEYALPSIWNMISMTSLMLVLVIDDSLVPKEDMEASVALSSFFNPLLISFLISLWIMRQSREKAEISIGALVSWEESKL